MRTVLLFWPAIILAFGAIFWNPQNKSVRRTGFDEHRVRPQTYDYFRRIIRSQGLQARVVPAFERGRATGFRILAIEPNSMLERLGFEGGDVVHSINEFDLTSPEKALRVYSSLNAAKMIAVRFTRAGEDRMMRYYLED